MKLKWYLLKYNLSIKDFAKIIDLSSTYVSLIHNNTKKPSKKIGRAIERVTNGIVTVDEVINPDKYPDPY